MVYRGVSWPRARCEPAARAGRLSCLAGGLPKGNCVPFFGESGRFRGKAGWEGGFLLLEVSFLFFFLFPFFRSTRMKDVREYISRVKLASLFDAFVKFVHFFMEFDARILFLFDKIL